MKSSSIIPLILCGGQSSRLFPFNKVLSDLTGKGKSLLKQSFDRAVRLGGKGSVHVLTVGSMAGPVRKALGLPASRVLCDPARRGTWPAILWAVHQLKRQGGDPVVAVLPADPYIPNTGAFVKSARAAVRLAATQPAIVMLGIRPSTDPIVWRGYGCFRVDESGRVVQFEEKPTLERATAMGIEGGWQWNAGNFFFRLSTIEAALARFQPAMKSVYDTLTAETYAQFPSTIPHPQDPSRPVDNTIDYAVMTPLVVQAVNDTLYPWGRGPADRDSHDRPQAPASGRQGQGEGTLRALAVPNALPRWMDIGQWDALTSLLKPDRRGNVTVGHVTIVPKVERCIVVADRGLRMDVRAGRDLVIAFSKGTALLVHRASLDRLKVVAQEAWAHSDRKVIEHDVTACDLHPGPGRIVAIGIAQLTVRLEPARLTVSSLLH